VRRRWYRLMTLCCWENLLESLLSSCWYFWHKITAFLLQSYPFLLQSCLFTKAQGLSFEFASCVLTGLYGTRPALFQNDSTTPMWNFWLFQ
jgi:hypothetical protein